MGTLDAPAEHSISIVIPVYGGEHHLPALMAEIAPLTDPVTTVAGHTYRVAEVLLVDDCGPDDSPRVMRELAAQYDWVKPVWLSRNFGQHPATIAGMASSFGDWIVTMDEDGQHDPADIGALLDVALSRRAQLVYAHPLNPRPHSAFRNLTSKASKWALNAVSGDGLDATLFHSYRLVLGEVGRSVAAYAGQGVYLDVALGWVAGRPATAGVTLRDEGERQSGYRLRTLASHFWRMVLTGGTRGLRLVSLSGLVFALFGLAVAGYYAVQQLSGADFPRGWTSLAVLMLTLGGMMLFSLGVVAEYVGVAVNMAMGRPAYLITGDPQDGPLGRVERTESP